jgi:hypothetical protein
MKFLLLIVLTLLIGFGLGATPGLNENLHWNLWFIIPVSGLILGMALGWLQFFGAYAMNLKIQGGVAWMLATAAAAAYLATEFGFYYTTSIPVAGVDGLPDGDYGLSQLLTFREYLAMTLESTSYEGQGSLDYEYGGAATKLTYLVDIIGCFGAAFLTRLTVSSNYPYCDRCNLYKKRDTKFEVKMQAGDEAAESFSNLLNLIADQNYQQITSYLKELSGKSDKDGDVMITADQRYCTSCKEASIVGRVFKNSGREWTEVDDLVFQFDSQPGEHLIIG